MTENSMNGASPIEVPKETTEAPHDAVAKARALIDTQVRQIAGTVIRGILVSAPGVPPHEVLNSIARVTGALLAEAVVADLQMHFKLREGFRHAFAEGTKKAPMNHPTQQPQSARPNG